MTAVSAIVFVGILAYTLTFPKTVSMEGHKKLVEVNMTTERIGVSWGHIEYGAYLSINKTRYTPVREETAAVLNHTGKTPNTVWPIKMVAVGLADQPKTNNTVTARVLTVDGYKNINPYYGTALAVNWTKIDNNTTNLFSYMETELSSTPLARICFTNCYLSK